MRSLLFLCAAGAAAGCASVSGTIAGELRDPAVPITIGRAAVGCGVRVSDVL